MSATAGADHPCVHDGDTIFPASGAASFATLDAAASAAGVTLATIPQTSFVQEHDGDYHLFVRKPNGEWWLFRKLSVDYKSDDGCDQGGGVTVERHHPLVVEIFRTDATEMAVEDGGNVECMPEMFEWTHLVIDERTGAILLQHSESMGRSVGPNGPDVTIKGDELSINGDPTVDASMNDLRRCAAKPGQTPAQVATRWIAEGRKATQARKLDDAYGLFCLAIGADPTHARAWSGRGYVSLKKGKKGYHRAKEDFTEALRLETNDAGFRAAVHFNLGQNDMNYARGILPKYARKYVEEAIAHFERSQKLKANKVVQAARDAARSFESTLPK